MTKAVLNGVCLVALIVLACGDVIAAGNSNAANNKCANVQNSYASGTMCLCVIGFIKVNDQCLINTNSPQTNFPTYLPESASSTANSKLSLNASATANNNIQCPEHSHADNSACICDSGYLKSSNDSTCIPSQDNAPNITLGNTPDFSCLQKGFYPIYYPTQLCKSICGDAIIATDEECDTSYEINDPGCINCKIVSGFSCLGEPSICQLRSNNNNSEDNTNRNQNVNMIDNSTKNITVNASSLNLTTNSTENKTFAAQPIATNTNSPLLNLNATANSSDNSSSTLQQVGGITSNSNNVFITLQTTPAFTFPNEVAAQSFLTLQFNNLTATPTSYCMQRKSPELDKFDCLLIFPSGVPNTKFNVNFAFDYQGKSGKTSVNVDTLAVLAVGRSKMTLSTVGKNSLLRV